MARSALGGSSEWARVTSIGTEPAKTSERKTAADARASAAVSAWDDEWDVANDDVDGVCRTLEAEAPDEPDGMRDTATEARPDEAVPWSQGGEGRDGEHSGRGMGEVEGGRCSLGAGLCVVAMRV